MNILAAEIHMYVLRNGLPTAETVPDVIDAVLRDMHESRHIEFKDSVFRGVDAWGQPLLLERRGTDTLVIRSRGSNGVDERGAGDDIERTVVVPAGSDRATKEWSM